MLDQHLHNRQPDAAALNAAGLGTQPVEWLKGLLQCSLVDTQAVVGHPQHGPSAFSLGLDAHQPARSVVLDGVGEQVQQHLTQPHRVAQHMEVERAELDLYLPILGAGGYQRQRGLDQAGPVHRLQYHPHLADLAAREFEHIVDQRQQVPPGVVHMGQPARPLGSIDTVAGLAQQLSKAQHCVQRRAQFMAYARHEG